MIPTYYINVVKYYISLLFSRMVKFGLPIFLLFSHLVNKLAFRFSYYSAFRIQPNGSARFLSIQQFDLRRTGP